MTSPTYRLIIALNHPSVAAESYLEQHNLDFACVHDSHTDCTFYITESCTPSGVLRAVAQTAGARARQNKVRCQYSISRL